MHLLSFPGGGHRPHFTVCSAALQREYSVELSTLKTPQTFATSRKPRLLRREALDADQQQTRPLFVGQSRKAA
jgi:hypothetical protein